MNKTEINAIAAKAVLFSAVAALFWVLTPNTGLATYATLVALAIFWLFYEVRIRKAGNVRAAFFLGSSLTIGDFIFQNIGFYLGLWASPRSVFPVLSVPIEIMALALIGGTAWAMHLPPKPSRIFMLAEVLLIGFFGALGEYILILNGMMLYQGWWTSLHAFFSYVAAFSVLICAWYMLLQRQSRDA